jgi:FMN phosphatase YigB (HAD superfamily)
MVALRAPLLPRVVTFDCWNTLLFEPDWKVAHGLRVSALELAAARVGGAHGDISREDAGRAFDIGWHRHMELWGKGGASGAAEVARWACEALAMEPVPEAMAELVDQFEEASHTRGVRALTGARETLAALAERGIRSALICDTGLTPGRVVRRHLDHHGLLEFLEVTIFSDEQGVPKPDGRVFDAALEGLSASPGDAVHVGDLKRTDVAGARAVGVASVRICDLYDDDSDHPEADHVVASHAELAELLLGPQP